MFFRSTLSVIALSLLLSWTILAETPRRMLELELEVVPGAKGYEVEITRILTDGSKKTPLKFKIQGSTWSAKLNPGKYEMRVRSFDNRNVPGDWGKVELLEVRMAATTLKSPMPNEEVRAKEERFEKVSFSWNEVEGAESYTLVVVDKNKNLKRVTTRAAKAEVELPTSEKYSWYVHVNTGGVEGDPSETQAFELVGPKLKAPIFATINDFNTDRIEWSEPYGANEYNYSLEVKSGKSWKEVQKYKTKYSQVIFKGALATGKYRFRVQALGEKREASDSSGIEFTTEKVNMTPRGLEQYRSEGAYDTKARRFLIASYQATFLNYKTSYAETNRNGVEIVNSISGTGRIGGGFWFKENGSWGIQFIGDMSGFIGNYSVAGEDKNQNFTYYSATLQGLWRKRLGALGQFRLAGGLFYRKLPMIYQPSPNEDVSTDEMITVGPILNATLSHALTRSIGIQANAMFSHSSYSVKTPGDSNAGKPSFQFGLSGTNQLTDNVVGFLGVAYRMESAGYMTTNGQNSVELSGMYLNMMLEYGF